jgi:hypothetical protein
MHVLSREEIFLTLEERTARLTILIDPRKKAVFERLCAEEDATPSQVVRRLLRGYIESRTGKPWSPAAAAPAGSKRRRDRKGAGRG